MITVSPQPLAPTTPRDDRSLDLFVCPFTVAVDTREQAPWPFRGITLGGREWLVPRKVQTLQTGDYSIVGLEDRIVIERKEAGDFTATISAGNARFRREHERMAEVIRAGGFCCIIVEGCMSAICDELDDPLSGRKIGSDVVVGWVASWPRRYGVHLFFAGDRRRAEVLAFRVLYKWWDEVGKSTNKEGESHGQVAS